MKQYKNQKQRKAHQFQIQSVKLSNFDLPLEPVFRREISENEKIMQRRQNVKTPFLTKREQYFEIPSERYLRSCQQSRFSSFIKGQIHQLHHNNERMAHFSQFARDKINQLKTIMNLKSLNMRKSQIKQYKSFNFREQRLNRKQNGLLQQHFSLHSRNLKNSPFNKSIKEKKIISKSMQLKGSTAIVSDQKKPIELGSQSTYGKMKKLVLLGGALKTSISLFNPEKEQIQKRSWNGYNYYNRFIRQTKTSLMAKKIEEKEEDYHPWEIQRGDSMFQQNC